MNVNNKLSPITRLTNQYFALRHGQSLANVAKIISSDPSISTVQHGLSELGKIQVRSSAVKFCSDYHHQQQKVLQNSEDGTDVDNTFKGVAVYASDFLRASETAQIFTSELIKAGVPLYNSRVFEEVRLRERYFGSWNGKSDEHYQDVWNLDFEDPDHSTWGVESVNSVVARTSSLVWEIDKALNKDISESCPKPWKVILVAHGDVLQIAQTAFSKVDGRLHRQLDHLETASVRELVLGECISPNQQQQQNSS